MPHRTFAMLMLGSHMASHGVVAQISCRAAQDVYKRACCEMTSELKDEICRATPLPPGERYTCDVLKADVRAQGCCDSASPGFVASCPKYDYIVVGSGPAGVAAARTLADANQTVLLLEQGKDLRYEGMNLTDVTESWTTTYDGVFETYTPFQTVNSTEGRYEHFPQTVGGGGALNLYGYHRPVASRCRKGFPLADQAFDNRFDEAALWLENELGYELRNNDDPRVQETYEHVTGRYPPDNGDDPSARSGSRYATTYTRNGGQQRILHTEMIDGHPNVVLVPETRVLSLLFSGTSCTGVRIERNGIVSDLAVRKEVMVAGGAYFTPKLLMESGIGPKNDLEAHHVRVVADLPVGQRFWSTYSYYAFMLAQAHTVKPLLYDSFSLDDRSLKYNAGVPHDADHEFAKAGGWFFSLGGPRWAPPGLPMTVEHQDAVVNYFKQTFGLLFPMFIDPDTNTGFTYSFSHEPAYRLTPGALQFAGVDENLKMTLNWFQEQDDVRSFLRLYIDTLEEYMRPEHDSMFLNVTGFTTPGAAVHEDRVQANVAAWQITSMLANAFEMANRAFQIDESGVLQCLVSAIVENNVTDARLDVCKDRMMLSLSSLWHWSGSAAQGSVVDRAFRVYGVQNLRVADMSVYNHNTDLQPQGLAATIGRVAALEMLYSDS